MVTYIARYNYLYNWIVQGRLKRAKCEWGSKYAIIYMEFKGPTYKPLHKVQKQNRQLNYGFGHGLGCLYSILGADWMGGILQVE